MSRDLDPAEDETLPKPRELKLATGAMMQTKGGLNRRHALRTLLLGGTTALGAAVLRFGRPEKVSADGAEGPTVFTSTTAATAAEGDNTLTSGAGGIGVKGSNTSTQFAAVEGMNASGGGAFYGVTSGAGFAAVQGSNGSTPAGSAGAGVEGDTTSTLHAAVEGFNNGAGTGVSGSSSGATGVLGTSFNGAGNTNVGVYGQATGSSGGIGVLGLCSNDVGSVGVYAQSATGKGFLGFSLSAGGVGAVGINSAAGVGIYGISQGGDNISNYGIVSQGAVYIAGALTVAPGFPKSAAVRSAGGGLRRMYCVESPESWFEDFGSGQLNGGSATVQIAADFAELVHGDAYHIFLTPRGQSKWLYVSKQTPGGFTVQEGDGGTSNIPFSYRVVAKRKDVAGVRLEHVDEPPAVQVPTAPLQPTTAPPHTPRQRHG